MKVIKYTLAGTSSTVEMAYSEGNEEIAKREALNGEYTVVDDGAEEAVQPTQEERLAKLEKDIADIPTLIRNTIKSVLGEL